MTMPEPQRLQSILESFDQKGVLVFGDAMLDEYWWGTVSRISPEAPVPVVGVDRTGHKPGGAANVALNIATLGASPHLISVTGDDRGRELLLNCLGEKNVNTSGLLIDSTRPTTRKTRIVAHSQQVVRADFESTDEINADVQARLWEVFTARLDYCRGVIISDYGKGVITGDLLQKIIKKTRAEGKFVVVDPKDTHFFSYLGVTTLTPNHHEAGFVAGRRITDDRCLREVGFDLLERLHADSLLITRGEKGMVLFEPPDVLTHFPTRATKVFDVTGAGDTVISAVAVALAAGADLKEAAYLANFAAGLVIREIGTAQTTRAALAKAVFIAGEKGAG
jgi:D-beta-D-heptose 7-phosphate kinase/D-beta-D-heptose 1-phosphate adenosyltransferase